MRTLVDGVFVYGSLKRGEANWRLAAHCTSRETAVARGTLYQQRNGFPAMTTQGDGQVHGELLRFDDLGPTLQNLDKLERYDPAEPQNSKYIRVPLEVVGVSGQTLRAWGYVFTPETVKQTGCRPIASGVWQGSRIARYTIRAARFVESICKKSRRIPR